MVTREPYDTYQTMECEVGEQLASLAVIYMEERPSHLVSITMTPGYSHESAGFKLLQLRGQLTTSDTYVTSIGRVTHSQESAINPLLHTRDGTID